MTEDEFRRRLGELIRLGQTAEMSAATLRARSIELLSTALAAAEARELDVDEHVEAWFDKGGEQP
ncbi:MAG TPA: hypothetical protein VMD59_02080 [Acidimicrobiales bacterium]|nr:hypothetical protein [Acidimicrobiales bacterium]